MISEPCVFLFGVPFFSVRKGRTLFVLACSLRLVCPLVETAPAWKAKFERCCLCIYHVRLNRSCVGERAHTCAWVSNSRSPGTPRQAVVSLFLLVPRCHRTDPGCKCRELCI